VRPAPQRRSPVPGSEQALREYIDAPGRGAPNYDDMTPQWAHFARPAIRPAVLTGVSGGGPALCRCGLQQRQRCCSAQAHMLQTVALLTAARA
jgi:hypothetical protein